MPQGITALVRTPYALGYIAKERLPQAPGDDHGATLDNLGCLGERNDVAAYLEKHGWRTARTLVSQLLADNGLPVPPRTDDEIENYYCSAVLGAR
jgi:hypothetical protein